MPKSPAEIWAMAQREWDDAVRKAATYGPYFLPVLAILAERDPLGIAANSGNVCWRTEYVEEATTIVPRLHEAESVADIQRIAHEEYVRSFGSSARTPDAYREIAQDIWAIMHTNADQSERR